MNDALLKLERCAAGDTDTAVLSRGDCVVFLSLWAAANEVDRFHNNTRPEWDMNSKPLQKLRRAIRKLTRTRAVALPHVEGVISAPADDYRKNTNAYGEDWRGT